eukprot:gene1747-33156_t
MSFALLRWVDSTSAAFAAKQHMEPKRASMTVLDMFQVDSKSAAFAAKQHREPKRASMTVLDMFQEGKSISEISLARGTQVGTTLGLMEDSGMSPSVALAIGDAIDKMGADVGINDLRNKASEKVPGVDYHHIKLTAGLMTNRLLWFSGREGADFGTKP